ncbi:RNA-binding protein 40-like protein [Leptotrombidium deliense]|uniref:RNA-binding region-containing protein 3 n=1 Tax=Leptotrombidium deliense TaxID=299467 RepID=A0A443SQS1_9ACAR|nr:RNA-binding protein 40-like protein [Leptotrombidium deliense]
MFRQLIVNTSTHNVEKDIEFRLKQKWTQLHSISQSLGLNYPFSPILKYKYPKANKATVTNIANALLRNSKFYTQVLHLMNKMNLPPPFEEVGRESRKDDKVISETDSESEIEIDEDLIANNSLVERSDFRRKRKKLEIGFVGPKKDLKRERKNKTTVSASVSDLFEETKTLPHKSVIEINVKHTLQSVQDEVDVNIGGFGIIERKKSDNEDLEINELEISEFITENELRDNRLTRSEYTQYSVFKNYEPGNQSCRLYVKNLDKKVEVHDLKRIFGKFVDWKSELERNTFHVCLLKEGRMKGQAFITFSNELNAKTALNETNGFKLNGKPMVVCFARSAKVN